MLSKDKILKNLRAIKPIILNPHQARNIQWLPTAFQLKYLISNQPNTIYFVLKRGDR